MKPAVTAILAIAFAALGFGVGYQTGRDQSHELAAPEVRPAGEAEGAIATVLRKPASLERVAELSALLAELGPDAIDEVIHAYQNAPIDGDDVTNALLATWWARYAPAEAFEWIQSNRKYATLSNTMAIREWARSDPAAAAIAYTSITVPEARARAGRSLAIGWLENGSPGFHEFAATSLSPTEQQLILDQLMLHLGETQGPAATLAFAEAVPESEGHYRTFALQRAVKAAAELDGPLAAVFAKRHGEGPEGRGVYQFAASRWASNDGPAALAWTSTLPPGKQRDVAVEFAFRSFALADRDAAVAWFPAGPVEQWLQPAIADYAVMLFKSDRAAGLAALGGLADEKRRRARTRALLGNWKDMAPRSYAPYIADPNLPEHVRRELDAAEESPETVQDSPTAPASAATVP